MTKIVDLKPEPIKKMQRVGRRDGFGLKTYSLYARMIAVAIYKQYGYVTVDDLRENFEHYKIPLIKNLWYTTFGSKEWKAIGNIKSARPVARKRSITMWVKK
jgi:hypothetical protein